MTKLEKVIGFKMKLGCADRREALEDILIGWKETGPYGVAKTFGVLDESESAEDFAIEFMTAYNKEILPIF